MWNSKRDGRTCPKRSMTHDKLFQPRARKQTSETYKLRLSKVDWKPISRALDQSPNRWMIVCVRLGPRYLSLRAKHMQLAGPGLHYNRMQLSHGTKWCGHFSSLPHTNVTYIYTTTYTPAVGTISHEPSKKAWDPTDQRLDPAHSNLVVVKAHARFMRMPSTHWKWTLRKRLRPCQACQKTLRPFPEWSHGCWHRCPHVAAWQAHGFNKPLMVHNRASRKQ